jgi:hypothetical protein
LAKSTGSIRFAPCTCLLHDTFKKQTRLKTKTDMTTTKQNLMIELRLFSALTNQTRPNVADLLNTSESDLKAQLETLKSNYNNKNK